MKTNFIQILIPGLLFLASACKPEQKNFDASGSFEAEETIISAEATGTLLKFEVTEGQDLDSGQVIGYIDSVQLFLKKKQLEAQVKALLERNPMCLFNCLPYKVNWKLRKKRKSGIPILSTPVLLLPNNWMISMHRSNP
jgi:HlyD family secretion protein